MGQWTRTNEGRPLLRPGRPRDVVGDELERLLVEHGYVGADTLEPGPGALSEPSSPVEPADVRLVDGIGPQSA